MYIRWAIMKRMNLFSVSVDMGSFFGHTLTTLPLLCCIVSFALLCTLLEVVLLLIIISINLSSIVF